jgi:hypothetical protein
MEPTLREELAVVRAVTFASLFEYPLTLPQLRHSLETAADETAIERWLTSSPLLRQAVCLEGGFVRPRARPELVERRLAREAASLRRLRSDAPVLRAMAALPFVRMVAISGSLAHLNGDEDADLDLFIVTSPARVWTVTVVALVMARAMGWRKRLCLNYVISQAALTVKPDDLFAANQIIHLQPVAGEATYRTFLDANPFVAACYPNFRPRSILPDLGGPSRRPMTAIVEWMVRPVAPVVERAARALYRKHLRRQSRSWHSPEHVQLEAECLKLHTNSHRESVMNRFEAAVADVFATVLTTCEDALPDDPRIASEELGVTLESWRRPEPSAVAAEPG